MTKPLALAFAFAFATPACAEVVDLGGPSDGTPDSAAVVESDEEGVVANVHEHPDFLISDGDRLYWAGRVSSFNEATGNFDNTTTIRSCRKTDCARSVIAYATAPFVAWLEVADGEVFFRPSSHGPEDPLETSILSCPTTGCTGDPRVVVEAAGAFTVAGDSIFFGANAETDSPGIYKKPRWGGDTTLVVAVQGLVAAEGPPRRILVRDDQLFWISSLGRLERTSVSKGGQIQMLFDDQLRTTRRWGFSLSSDREALYWSTYDLTSSIQRCALAGCPSGPEVAAASVRMPCSLFASEGHLYLNVELTSSEVGLVSCLPFDCANPRLLGIAKGRGFSTIAADERFVYAFSNQGFDGDTVVHPTQSERPSAAFLSSLRRYEK